MDFFLTPRFAPAYQQCGPFACAPSRPQRYSRPSAPSFIPFLSQVDGLLSEIDREVRHAAQQHQQRKRTFRARFDVKEHKDAYEVLGDVPGFEQQNINIEVTDEHNLRISGDTERVAEQPIAEQPTTDSEADRMDGITLNEPEESGTATPAESDTESHKPYQPTVEDDFEDLGAETSSTVSQSSAPAEPKGKEKAVEEPKNTSTSVQKQSQLEAPAQPEQPETREWLSERVRGSFERTFEFPERINMANVKASLKNGVLSVIVPKAPAFQTKRITIQ